VVLVVVRYGRGEEIFAGDKVVLSFRDGLVLVSVDGELRALFYVDDLDEVLVEGNSGGEEG